MKNKKLKINETLPLSYDTQGRGTHILTLPSDKFLKKYHNKINYLMVKSDGTYSLSDAGLFGNSKKVRLERHHIYSPIFLTNSIEGVDFKWIENSIIYDKFGNIIK